MDAALEQAATFAALPPVALRLAKRAVVRSWDADMESALEMAATYQGIAQNTEDHQESVEAMLEKRAPRLSGR